MKIRPHLYILKKHLTVGVYDAIEWGTWFEKADRIVKQETVDGALRVSTVFLGVDRGYSWMPGPGYRPLLFETMVFKDQKALSEYTRRYSTWTGAETGHIKVVEDSLYINRKARGQRKIEHLIIISNGHIFVFFHA